MIDIIIDIIDYWWAHEATPAKQKSDQFAWANKEAIRLLTLNVRGLQDIAQRQQVVKYMKDHNIHIALLQETHVNTCSKENHQGYHFYVATEITKHIWKLIENRNTARLRGHSDTEKN